MHVKKWTRLIRRAIPCQSCGAVIVAAGGPADDRVDKIMADLGESPSWSGRFGPLRPRQ